MNHFKDVIGIQSVVVALGITRLLSSLVFVFKSRARTRLDWIPIAWALCVFLWQLQFAWATIELSDMVAHWVITDFLAMLVLPILLFLAAALVLPLTNLAEGDGLRQSFHDDGRWGLACLALYFLWSIFVNRHFWHISPVSLDGALSTSLGVVPLLFLFTRNRPVQAAITVTYVILSLVGAYHFSPLTY